MKLLERAGIRTTDAAGAASVAFHEYVSDRSAALLLRERPGTLEIGSAVCCRIGRTYLAATAAHNVLNLDPMRIEVVPAGELRARAIAVRRLGHATNWEDEDVAWLELEAEPCPDSGRLRFVTLDEISILPESESPIVCFLQGYPSQNVEPPPSAQERPLPQSDGLMTLVIPAQRRRVARDARVIGIEYPPHDGSLDASGVPHPCGLSGGAVWLFPTFPGNQVWSPRKARFVAIERGWWREEREVIATRIEVWLRLVAVQIPELRSTIEARFGPFT